MKSLWYDRDGKPMESGSRMEFLLSHPDYKRVALTQVSGKVSVSTVWLGIDHSFDENTPPVIFETMVFGGKHDQHQMRYSTEMEALKGHERVVSMVKPWWKRWGITLAPKGE